MFFTGIIIALATFLIIGLFHPIVIKTQYHSGTSLQWLFAILGMICIIIALFIENVIVSSIMGVLGASFLWSVKELFEQEKRVEKGWFPKNPNRDQLNNLSKVSLSIKLQKA